MFTANLNTTVCLIIWTTSKEVLQMKELLLLITLRALHYHESYQEAVSWQSAGNISKIQKSNYGCQLVLVNAC